jgi:hypothetical protein
MKLLRDKIKGFFIPVFSPLSLFMMSASFLLVFFFTESLRNGLSEILDKPGRDLRTVILLLFFTAGLLLSLYHVFAERQISGIEKHAMLFFAVLSNGFCGIFASRHILGVPAGETGVFHIMDTIRNIIDGTGGTGGASRIFLILPIWNIINCVFLLACYRTGVLNERNISDEKAGPFEVLFAFLIIVCIFLFCRFVLKLYWAVTFSICVIYATSFGEALGSLLYPERHQAVQEKIAMEEAVRAGAKLEKCGLCERPIAPDETPYVINRKLIVCKQCYDKIQSHT